MVLPRILFFPIKPILMDLSRATARDLILLMAKNQETIPSKDFIELNGEVTELLPAASFRVKLENGHAILAHLSGKMRMFKIRLLPGDRVKVQMTPYDLTKGRITYRF